MIVGRAINLESKPSKKKQREKLIYLVGELFLLDLCEQQGELMFEGDVGLLRDLGEMLLIGILVMSHLKLNLNFKLGLIIIDNSILNL